jgi:DNA invertase Pin-like site-specific DNA recombinase
MKKYYLYARVSSRSAGKTTNNPLMSIDSQVKVLRQFAKKNRLNIKGISIDFGSANSVNRPAFNAMLAKIKNGKDNGILCMGVDRLSKSSETGLELLRLISERDAEIVTPSAEYNRGSFIQSLYGLGLAKGYSYWLSEAVKRGLRAKRQRLSSSLGNKIIN